MKSESDESDKKTVEAVKTTAHPKITVPTPDPKTLVGATGSCDLSPAVNEVKGGLMDCRESSSGQVLCMIKCAENFRPWHGELIIVCRNGVYYNRKNPLQVQKNMKCKEANCDPDKYGIACFNHPKNRERREGEFERALRYVKVLLSLSNNCLELFDPSRRSVVRTRKTKRTRTTILSVSDDALLLAKTATSCR